MSVADDVVVELRLAGLDSLRAAHDGLLSPTERDRRAEFRQPADRRRYTLATALLRVAAGRRLGIDPAAVDVDRSCDECGRPHGRPTLPGTVLHASISHSGDRVAVALTDVGPVGVDVERLGEVDAGLARSVCTPDELGHLRTPEDFFVYWTRKEAVLKATGDGLRRPLSDVVVSPPHAIPELIRLGDDPPPPCRLAGLDVGPDYRGALAVLTTEPVVVTIAG